MNILEVIARQARSQPTAPALIAGEQIVTYGELMASVVTLASQLSELGVSRHDVVAIAAPGLLRHVVLTLAVAHVGAVSLPVPPKADAESAALADACGAKFLVHHQPEGFSIDAPCLQTQISVRTLTSRAPGPAVAMVNADGDDLFRIGLSSGTTGRPKPIRFTHRSAVLRTHLTRTVFPSGPGERVLLQLPVPLYFSLGYWLSALMCGAAVVEAGPSPMESLRRHRATFLLSSPASAADLVKVAQGDARFAEPPPDLKTMTMGGATASPALQANVRAHLCRNLHINYGITEAGGLVALADPELLEADPSCAGRLLPWVEAQAVGERGEILPPGRTGLLRVRSPSMAVGYAQAQGTVDPFRDGWFYSNDRGRVTPDGLVHLAGRADVLNVNGRKVDPGRIEAVMAQDPAVLECVAVAVPDALAQAQLIAVVVAAQPFDRAALKQRCLETLGPALVPKGVVVVNKLPHNEAGKVPRDKVVAMVRRQRELAAAKKTS